MYRFLFFFKYFQVLQILLSIIEWRFINAAKHAKQKIQHDLIDI